jgi:putative peptide zinc metalloprotease protein
VHTLFEFHFLSHHIALVVRVTGAELVLVDGIEVASSSNPFSDSSEHHFSLPTLGLVTLKVRIAQDTCSVSYRLQQYEHVLHEAVAALDLPQDLGRLLEIPPKLQQVRSVDDPEPAPAAPSGNTKRASWIPLIGTIFKLSKSAGAIKVALAGASFASWSLLTDWRFAAILISIIVFHEYGHVRAMRACGIATKGLYLIPFFGGVAIGERARSYWHEVYVSMMGPVFGLLMTLVALVGYWWLDSQLLGLVASYSALINLFNLLPIYPLDGGHVIKAVAVSASPARSVIGLLLLSAAGFAAALHYELHLLSFFLVLGVVDLLLTRSSLVNKDVTPMQGYAMLVSVVWYIAVVAIFVAIILYLVEQAVPGSEIPKLILTD